LKNFIPNKFNFPKDTFSFKSKHLVQYPFDVKFYVNGHAEGHLLTCCEHKYRRGGFRLSRSFIIEHVQKSIPCQRLFIQIFLYFQ
jgi:hypothetical protein